MSADSILLRYIYIFFFCNIFPIIQIRAIFSNFAVLPCKLNGHCRKIPDMFFIIFFYKNCFPSPYLLGLNKGGGKCMMLAIV